MAYNSLKSHWIRRRKKEAKEKARREPETTMVIADSKSIQNADTANEKGYDAGKKVRHKATYGG